MDQIITIDGKKFELLRVQSRGASGVYKGLPAAPARASHAGGQGTAQAGDGEYLRIGEPGIVHRHVNIHRKMEEAGFPVPALIKEGVLDGKAYFIETSVGEKRLGDAFAEDCNKHGVIQEETFKKFLDIVERYTRAQLRAPKAAGSIEHLARGIHLNELCSELSAYAIRIREKFKDVFARITIFPSVITHGDFNPQNLFKDGVIDLEDAFYAPVGYDPISALTTINFFPDSKEFEYFARYRFSDTQRSEYLATLDRLFTEAELPKLSKYADEFEFCRAIWCSVGMQKWPKIQKWRYDTFVERFL